MCGLTLRYDLSRRASESNRIPAKEFWALIRRLVAPATRSPGGPRHHSGLDAEMMAGFSAFGPQKLLLGILQREDVMKRIGPFASLLFRPRRTRLGKSLK